jgi:hypothetical protein
MICVYKKIKNITIYYIMKLYPKNIKEYDFLRKNNYTIKELKDICNFFHFKPKNKKKELLNDECYYFLMKSYYISKIQQKWRKYIIKSFKNTQGPAIFNRKLCNNVDDFLTTETMTDIDYYFFISYKDTDGFVYGFNIISLYTLIMKENTTNPYTRNPFNVDFIDIIKKRTIYNKILGKINHPIQESVQYQTIDQKLIGLFHKMDNLGNYTQSEWLTKLPSYKLRRFIIELYDIWNYRAQLTPDIKLLICPPNGNPFFNIPLDTIELNTNFNISMLKHYCYIIIHLLIHSAVTRENQSLGAIYVLTALTIVNKEAADALPWLYESIL